MVPLLPLRDGVRALPISSFRQSMPSFYMNARHCNAVRGVCRWGRSARGATIWKEKPCTMIEFQSAHPCGVRRKQRYSSYSERIFQSTRPVGARQDLPAVLKPVAAISIHAPHGRGGVSAGRPAGRSLCRTGSSCAYRVRSDCRSGTIRRGSTGCRCSWKCPNRRT